MQTFLPYSDFSKSAQCLDNRRLGKQRVECLQILKSLTNADYGWKSHPSVKMWKNHEGALADYGNKICLEWISRGYKDTCLEKISNMGIPFDSYPDWIGNESFHASHRSNLLRKDNQHYSRFGWKESADLPYIWPK